MSDYAASPVQPILQGLVTVIPQEVGLPLVSFYGRGCKAVVADVTGVLLTLDGGIAGTPGNAGLPGVGGLDTPYARALVTLRGTATTIQNKIVTYPTQGTVHVAFLDVTPATVYQTFEIVVWRGDAGVEPTTANLVGFPSVIFP
jgi:hypothetical protein